MKAIEVLARGSVWTSEETVTSMARKLRKGTEGPPASASDQLLLTMLDEGLSNKEMASRLGLAEVTIKTRLSRLYRRFGVNSRVQLLSFAVKNGLIRSV